MTVRAYREQDVPAMIEIWNEVVEEGIAFPQEELLDKETGSAFFKGQSYWGKSLCLTVSNRPDDLAFGYCSLMRWWRPIFMPGIYMRG